MAPAIQFPLFRLGTLLARQLSKPVANKIKKIALEHPWFRRTVCARTGRVFHTLQLRLRLWTLALHQPRELPPLSEQAALDSGADILGEVAVFGLGGLIVIFEVNRQADKQEDKLLDEESRRVALLLSLQELRRELALQQQDIERLHATLRHLAPQHYRAKPSPPTTASPTPSTSKHSTPPSTNCLAPPIPDCPPPPIPDCPPPPIPDCPPPPISDCPPPPISDCLAPAIPEFSSSSIPDCPASSIPDCPPPPIPECCPPPIPDYPPPVK